MKRKIENKFINSKFIKIDSNLVLINYILKIRIILDNRHKIIDIFEGYFEINNNENINILILTILSKINLNDYNFIVNNQGCIINDIIINRNLFYKKIKNITEDFIINFQFSLDVSIDIEKSIFYEELRINKEFNF